MHPPLWAWLFLPILCALCCGQADSPEKAASEFSDARIHAEANYDRFRASTEGIAIIGELAEDDVGEIAAIVRTQTSSRLVVIEVTDRDQVQAQTGVMRGILDGEGEWFKLKWVKSKWILQSQGDWVS